MVVVFILVLGLVSVAPAAATTASSSLESLTLTLVTLVRSRSDREWCGFCCSRCDDGDARFEVEPLCWGCWCPFRAERGVLSRVAERLEMNSPLATRKDG